MIRYIIKTAEEQAHKKGFVLGFQIGMAVGCLMVAILFTMWK